MNVVEYIIKSYFDSEGVNEGQKSFKELEQSAADYGEHAEKAVNSAKKAILNIDPTLRELRKHYEALENVSKEQVATSLEAAVASGKKKDALAEEAKELKRLQAEQEKQAELSRIAAEQAERLAQAATDKDMGAHYRDYTDALDDYTGAMRDAEDENQSLVDTIDGFIGKGMVAAAAIKAVEKSWQYMRDTAKAAWQEVTEWTQKSVDAAVRSFGKLADAFAQARENLSLDRERGASKARARDEQRQGYRRMGEAELENERQRALQGVTDKEQVAAINLDFNRQKEDLRLLHERETLKNKLADNSREQNDIKKQIALIDQESAAYEKAIATARKMREGTGEVDMRGRGAQAALEKLLGFIPDNAGEMGADLQRQITDAIKGAMKKQQGLKNERDRLAIRKEELAASRNVLQEDLRIVEKEKESAQLRRQNEDAVRKANKEAKSQAEREKKAEEQRKADRQQAIADKRKELAQAQEKAKVEAQAAKDNLAALKAQQAETARLLAQAQAAAQAQMPTNASSRADRKRRKHGGYDGGGVGEDGIAGTWDDEKAMKRAERIAKKLNRNRNNPLKTKLSKEDEEFYKQWLEGRKAHLNAKELAQQKEKLMLDAAKAQTEALNVQKQMAADIKKTKDQLDALLKAK